MGVILLASLSSLTDKGCAVTKSSLIRHLCHEGHYHVRRRHLESGRLRRKGQAGAGQQGPAGGGEDKGWRGQALLSYGARLDILNNGGLLPADMLKMDFNKIRPFLMQQCGNDPCYGDSLLTFSDYETWAGAGLKIDKILASPSNIITSDKFKFQ